MREPALSVGLADAAATEALGAALAATRPQEPAMLTLAGDLGAGKTTLTRGLLRALGVTGPIRSPTYTLAEPYDTPAGEVLHLDLYRLSGPAELHELGFRDLAAGAALVVVEWPERAGALAADLSVGLELAGRGRQATVVGASGQGAAWLARLRQRLLAGTVPAAGSN